MRTINGGGLFEVGGVWGIWNQNPSRMERDVVSEVKMKWYPAGIDLMPWNWGVVVKERRSMEQRIEEGRERRRAVGVEIG